MPTTNAPFITLAPHDLLWATRRLPKAVREMLGKHGPELVVAGGYIRSTITNEKIEDIDLFTTSKQKAQEIAIALGNQQGKRFKETDNAFTVIGYAYPIQIIHRWTFEQPLNIIPSFDFTIARACFWRAQSVCADVGSPAVPPKWESLADPEFYSDLAGKRIVYRCPIRNEDAGGSILRVLKFYQRGYRIPLDSLGEVMARMMQGVDRDAGAFRSEEHLAKVLTGLLREVDPMIDPDHITHLPASVGGEEANPEPDSE